MGGVSKNFTNLGNDSVGNLDSFYNQKIKFTIINGGYYAPRYAAVVEYPNGSVVPSRHFQGAEFQPDEGQAFVSGRNMNLGYPPHDSNDWGMNLKGLDYYLNHNNTSPPIPPLQPYSWGSYGEGVNERIILTLFNPTNTKRTVTVKVEPLCTKKASHAAAGIYRIACTNNICNTGLTYIFACVATGSQDTSIPVRGADANGRWVTTSPPCITSIYDPIEAKDNQSVDLYVCEENSINNYIIEKMY